MMTTETILIQLSEETRALYDLQAASLGRSLEEHLSILLETHLGQTAESEPVKSQAGMADVGSLPRGVQSFKPFAGRPREMPGLLPVDDKRSDGRTLGGHATAGRGTDDLLRQTMQATKAAWEKDAQDNQKRREEQQQAEAAKAKQAEDLKLQEKALQHAANEIMGGIG